nr:exocyst complex component SEC8 [Ipomoea batatas]
MDSRQQRREGIEAAINFLNLILGFVITIKSLQYVHLIKLRGVLFYKILEDLHTHLYHKGEHRSLDEGFGGKAYKILGPEDHQPKDSYENCQVCQA